MITHDATRPHARNITHFTRKRTSYLMRKKSVYVIVTPWTSTVAKFVGSNFWNFSRFRVSAEHSAVNAFNMSLDYISHPKPSSYR